MLMAMMIGLRSSRPKVSRSTRPMPAPRWSPASARTRASGSISRFSTIIPSARPTAALGPTTMATIG
ncbi:hypothetical protein D9M73_268110 [compost metagenome]